jgi:hypothetical protein
MRLLCVSPDRARTFELGLCFLREIADLLAVLDHVASTITPEAFSRAAVRVHDTAGSGAAENDLAGIIHRAIRKEPSDIRADHDGRDQERDFGLPIHGALVA